MNKAFINDYRRKLLVTHILVEVILLALLVLFYLMGITVFRDIIAQLLGYRFSSWVLNNLTGLMISGTLVVLVAGWIVVEWRSVGKLANVLGQMEVIFRRDEDKLVLGKEFKEIENELNSLKFQNRRNEQLAQMEAQRKTDLITYLAHDIKTPLASVIGYLSLLDEAPDMPPDQRAKYTHITLEKAFRLEELVNEFFDITRFNLSTIPLEKENIRLGLMMEQMADEFYPMLQQGNRSVKINIDQEFTIYGDADKLARVFNNILKNAVFYSYENSVIEVSAEAQEQNTCIRFKNNGKVIPQHQLKAKLEKFFRLDNARST